MKITIEVGNQETTERTAQVAISPSELAKVHLHLAFPERRNRTGLYMRRHPVTSGATVGAEEALGPNSPLRSEKEPPKLSIADHIAEMRCKGILPRPVFGLHDGADTFGIEPAMLAVPISDLVANLLRPCFHCDGFGEHRLFYLDGEPIKDRSYWCLCFFHDGNKGHLEFRRVFFDAASDQARDLTGADLQETGLIWAAALVPLVVDGHPLTPVEIAQSDYDLRQILGRDSEDDIRYAYEGWYGEWDERVERIVKEHEARQRPFASFYHSVIAIDQKDNILLYQLEATLPDLANRLASDGVKAAGLLDSGGSCALYDVWMASYLNHGWYHREPRGAILVFELHASQRLPVNGKKSWAYRRPDLALPPL